jgi:hypothetical protein
MALTEEETDFLESLTALASIRPPLSPLKNKDPHTRARSKSLGLHINLHKISSNLTGPPSPSVSDASGSISDPCTNLASSLWPQKEGSSYSFPPSVLRSSTSHEPEPDSDAGAVEGRRVDLPPISPSRKSGPSESLPPLMPQLSRPPSPSAPTRLLTPTPSRERSVGINPFPFRLSYVNWEEPSSRSSNTPLIRNRQRNQKTLWTAIQEAGVPIYFATPGFDGGFKPPYMHDNMIRIPYTVFALCPSASGTYCSPTALPATLCDIEVFYHVYAAGQKLSREDL